MLNLIEGYKDLVLTEGIVKECTGFVSALRRDPFRKIVKLFWSWGLIFPGVMSLIMGVESF